MSKWIHAAMCGCRKCAPRLQVIKQLAEARKESRGLVQCNFADLVSRPRFCVYIWKRGDEVLYVGQTVNLLYRLGRHHVINKVEPALPTDELIVEEFATESAMRHCEIALIQLLSPKYNQIHRSNFPRAAKLHLDITN